MNTISIIESNYFGHTETNDFNAKVLYSKNGKTYLAHVFIDFFNKKVHTFKVKQPKECKILKGFSEAINNHEFKTN